MPRPVGRPRGEVAAALRAAAEQAPGTVRELAARSLVGRKTAGFTATRMLQRGELVVVVKSRPAILGVPTEARDPEAAAADLAAALQAWR